MDKRMALRRREEFEELRENWIPGIASHQIRSRTDKWETACWYRIEMIRECSFRLVSKLSKLDVTRPYDFHEFLQTSIWGNNDIFFQFVKSLTFPEGLEATKFSVRRT